MLEHLAKYPQSFDPDTVKILSEALDTAWERVQRSGAILDDPAAARTELAKLIIGIAETGERDGNLLVSEALLRFRL